MVGQMQAYYKVERPATLDVRFPTHSILKGNRFDYAAETIASGGMAKRPAPLVLGARQL